MKNTIGNIKKILLNQKEMFEQYKIKNLGIFGSYLAGKNKKNSDIDLLVEFKESVNIFEFIHLRREIQKILKTKIDLTTPNALKPYIKNKILHEVNWIEKP